MSIRPAVCHIPKLRVWAVGVGRTYDLIVEAHAEFVVTRVELVDATRRRLFHSRRFWVQVMASILIMAVGLSFAINGQPAGWFAFGIGVGAWIADIASPLIRARRSFDASSFKADTNGFRFDAAGLEYHSEHADARLPWSSIQRVQKLGRNYVVLLEGSRIMYVIPARGFASPEDERSFRSLTAACTRTSWKATEPADPLPSS